MNKKFKKVITTLFGCMIISAPIVAAPIMVSSCSASNIQNNFIDDNVSIIETVDDMVFDDGIFGSDDERQEYINNLKQLSPSYIAESIQHIVGFDENTGDPIYNNYYQIDGVQLTLENFIQPTSDKHQNIYMYIKVDTILIYGDDCSGKISIYFEENVHNDKYVYWQIGGFNRDINDVGIITGIIGCTAMLTLLSSPIIYKKYIKDKNILNTNYKKEKNKINRIVNGDGNCFIARNWKKVKDYFNITKKKPTSRKKG